MIKFFRRIRQRLLSENKISKYLLYAIGEIVLVVIGILIALAINNSNQRRVIEEKEQVYLKGLKEEFETSKAKLTVLTDINRKNLREAKKLIGYASDNTKIPDEEMFSEILFNTFSPDISFNPNNSLLDEIINSGSLKDISNTRLRVRLTNWISTIEDVSKQEQELAIQREKVLDIFRRNENSLRTILDLTGVNEDLGIVKLEQPESNLKLLDSREFENNILMFILTSKGTEEAHYLPLMDELNTILDLIDKEIQ
ncbi:hypothetical protein C5O00_08070 [Pukyongia salina]|uniref:Uncharacterized protein n=1 Tax=Pukyongia salina TaxID=2094025 RepID=A0A2S0HWU8_9FLAO|nr:DUF6090 family protein [Pukyongia salina]AVI51132.1 hypothetical protein C5O00_08070 [Pukyongia salina]